MDEQKFEDAEGYSYNFNKDKLTFKDLILQHLKKITTLASVEFRGGYWEERHINTSHATNTIRTYIPDTRECYSNAVECFADMLFPYFDKEMKEAEDKCKKRIDKAFVENSVTVEPEREDETEEEEKKGYRRFKETRDKISFRSEKRRYNRKLFRALCSFLYRKKYLELGSIED
jgi:hypothetical protein